MWSVPGGGGTQCGTLVRIHVQEKKRQKGVIFVTNWWGPGTSKRGVILSKKGRCLTEDAHVTPIKRVLW